MAHGHPRCAGRRHVAFGVTSEIYAWVAESMIAAMAERGAREWTPDMTAA